MFITVLDSDDVRVVILTGAGSKSFCAGGNLSPDSLEGAANGFKARPDDPLPPTVTGAARALRSGMTTSQLLREMPKPTIAAINGACAGAGLSWACACDLRFAAETSVFRTAFLTAGLSGDYGASWTLPRIVTPAKARELFLLNPKVSAADALAMGLVSAVFKQSEFLPRVLAIANELALAPPLALSRIKANLLDADRELSFCQHLDIEADRHARSAFHPDAAEAGTAFMVTHRCIHPRTLMHASKYAYMHSCGNIMNRYTYIYSKSAGPRLSASG